MSHETMECDLLVLGSGMAGLSAAGWAAERGARVVVVEKASTRGGSAVLSGGVVWTATSASKMSTYGCGDPKLGAVVLDAYPQALAWIRSRGIQVSPAMDVLHGRGYAVDLIHHLDDCIQMVEKAGGYMVYGTTTETLLKDDAGKVIGARTVCADGTVDVIAANTILATGGYQGSPELRAQNIHENARNLLLRSNPVSQGDGIRLGTEAGGVFNKDNKGFYGHLVTKSPNWGEERYYTGLSQYHSDHSLLFNEQGFRYCDETEGDHTNTYRTVFETNARAIVLWDKRIQETYATAHVVLSAPPLDKYKVAIENGGEGVHTTNVAQLEKFATAHGFDGAQVVKSLAEYQEGATNGWENLNPPRRESAIPLDGEYYALVVYSAITFTFGGLMIDTEARVLKDDGSVLPGLLAAGSDAGGAYGIGYAGGLAMAMTFGITAAQTAGWQ